VPHCRIASAAAFLLAAVAAAAHADSGAIAVAAGEYGFRKEIPHSVAFDAELRAPWHWTIVRPVAGILATTGGAAYLYSGLAFEIPLTGSLRVTPGFAPGVLLAMGEGDLGSRIEFRSSLELSLVIDPKVRVGVAISHISNARLGTSNPGVEVLTLGFAFPGG
jgi:hypothetical protein